MHWNRCFEHQCICMCVCHTGVLPSVRICARTRCRVCACAHACAVCSSALL